MTELFTASPGGAGFGWPASPPLTVDYSRNSDERESVSVFARAAHLARHAAAVAVTMMFALPCLGQAQKPASSLAELKARAKIGETLLVADDSGREVKGKLLDLSADALTLKVRGVSSTFAEDNIRLVQRPDTLWRGILIGAAIGAGLAIWDYSVDPSEPGNAVISVVAIGGGAAIGAGIDAMVGGPKTLFLPPPRVRRAAALSVAPMLSGSRCGVTVSVHFGAQP